MSNDEELDDEGMTFWEHLHELRSRLVKMAVAAIIGGSVAWFFKEDILGWLLDPFTRAFIQSLGEAPKIHFPDPAGLFLAYLKVSIVGGIIFALPLIFYQLWAFIAPGLYKKEKQFAIPFVCSSTGLFCGGAFYGMKFAFPLMFGFLLSFASTDKDDAAGMDETSALETAPASTGITLTPGELEGESLADRLRKQQAAEEARKLAAEKKQAEKEAAIQAALDLKPKLQPTIMVGEYIKFVTRLLLLFGLMFQLPVVVFFLSVAGIVNHTHLIKFWRYFIVIAFAVGAIFTPPDLMSQMLFAIPLSLLYVVSIGIAYIFGKKKPKDDKPSPAAS